MKRRVFVNYKKIIYNNLSFLFLHLEHLDLKLSDANKQLYTNQANGSKAGLSSIESLYEKYEYLLLKQYFTTPFYPLFKASTLRKDFDFGLYLQHCLVEKLGLTFNISWTCLFFSIFFIILWNVVVAPASVLAIVITLILNYL